ncbi:hypothetical protein HPB52_010416 [Rhipicephalus sanguineus]|uniref:Tick transposon n=1 Tax=Rhipicephalus sanguineus TaxID=34632 RepID=A0A9D4PZ31_RHISA|nr:hypothetical protein HPB52_010416 [Rhipicephalus sanguineus]
MPHTVARTLPVPAASLSEWGLDADKADSSAARVYDFKRTLRRGPRCKNKWSYYATQAVAARDYSQARLKKLLVTVHPDRRAAGPMLLPETGLTRRERASLLRLRIGCVWTAARRYMKGRCASPACSRCGDPETLELLLCTCPGLAKERSTVTTAYRRQGLPATTLQHLLLPSRPHLPALRSLAVFLEETGIAAYH